MRNQSIEEIYLAGGCLWGVQEFVRHLPGVLTTEAGRANGRPLVGVGAREADNEAGEAYNGYAECVRTRYDSGQLSVESLMDYFFEVIDPYSLDRQGPDIGRKYRSGVYSRSMNQLDRVRAYLSNRGDAKRIVVEVGRLTHYVKSAAEHQDRLTRCPDEKCHLPIELLHRYKSRIS